MSWQSYLGHDEANCWLTDTAATRSGSRVEIADCTARRRSDLPAPGGEICADDPDTVNQDVVDSVVVRDGRVQRCYEGERRGLPGKDETSAK